MLYDGEVLGHPNKALPLISMEGYRDTPSTILTEHPPGFQLGIGKPNLNTYVCWGDPTFAAVCVALAVFLSRPTRAV